MKENEIVGVTIIMSKTLPSELVNKHLQFIFLWVLFFPGISVVLHFALINTTFL